MLREGDRILEIVIIGDVAGNELHRQRQGRKGFRDHDHGIQPRQGEGSRRGFAVPFKRRERIISQGTASVEQRGPAQKHRGVVALNGKNGNGGFARPSLVTVKIVAPSRPEIGDEVLVAEIVDEQPVVDFEVARAA